MIQSDTSNVSSKLCLPSNWSRHRNIFKPARISFLTGVYTAKLHPHHPSVTTFNGTRSCWARTGLHHLSSKPTHLAHCGTYTWTHPVPPQWTARAHCILRDMIIVVGACLVWCMNAVYATLKLYEKSARLDASWSPFIAQTGPGDACPGLAASGTVDTTTPLCEVSQVLYVYINYSLIFTFGAKSLILYLWVPLRRVMLASHGLRIRILKVVANTMFGECKVVTVPFPLIYNSLLCLSSPSRFIIVRWDRDI